MGVFGTFCQICGMPLQHNCFIPDPSDAGADEQCRRYLIYRGSQGGGTVSAPAFISMTLHAWLLDVVALRHHEAEEPQVYRCRHGVQDGDIKLEDGRTIDLELGDGDRFGIHERCWQLAGYAERADLAFIKCSVGWRQLESRFHAQLFDFERLLAEGSAWMLADPGLDTEEASQNRTRIEGLIAEGRLMGEAFELIQHNRLAAAALCKGDGVAGAGYRKCSVGHRPGKDELVVYFGNSPGCSGFIGRVLNDDPEQEQSEVEWETPSGLEVCLESPTELALVPQRVRDRWEHIPMEMRLEGLRQVGFS
eukprot:gnl/TRDRNA2_/TRDRNA2_62512_c0_seq1.p1 gnl/TRDRNA2_/TRDRNA2_62512_c0~~gnl/TRDRNA2_/TRDRNA2_62512_c0_seq1.p1  ORF type:complete len:307 (-),score=51.06 gnl/TRDRNA2_/TRDRNA2_62512_c0_seq1:266-1186(-)